MEPGEACVLAFAGGLCRESASESDNSHREVRCRIEGILSGSSLLIYRVPYFFRPSWAPGGLLSVDSQSDEKQDHETYTQDTHEKHDVGRRTRNYDRLKHS
jgi:hypothetical protein